MYIHVTGFWAVESRGNKVERGNQSDDHFCILGTSRIPFLLPHAQATGCTIYGPRRATHFFL
jgi:hypothetical protein